MARAVTAVPYNVVLPDIIGNYVSTGIYVALVGDPGHGKGSSDGAAARLMPCDIYSSKLGSGEGITHQFAGRDKDGELVWHERSILFESSEAETMRALAGRKDATLMGELRSAWMGEQLGFAYSDVKKRLVLKALSYRLSVLASFTPSVSDVLLDGVYEGTPQRFLYLPVSEPELPDEDFIKRPRSQLRLNIPSVNELDLVQVEVPSWVRYELREDHRAKVRREFGQMSESELLDTHINLVRLKTAFALGLVTNPHRNDYYVSEDDWEMSEYIMNKSRETRDRMIEAAESARVSKDRKEGHSLGTRYAASDEVRKLGSVPGRILTILREERKNGKSNGWMSGGNIRNKMTQQQRKAFSDAMDSLTADGKVETKPGATSTPSSGSITLTLRYRIVKKLR
jgi:hypothetical protein